eukprot:TRINITY_DN4672_c0_g1_i1.p1 TRINITY_DN4672_c0_g1~~TRINITY_DN4672_c0_g1_i1.p1  ORF type:complete len:295 (+),score=39.28 TRINITY_DN4672_c0_g1_i1:87-971(+)
MEVALDSQRSGDVTGAGDGSASGEVERAISVMNLVGSSLLTVSPCPALVGELKVAIESQEGTPQRLQRLVVNDKDLADTDDLTGIEEVLMIVDESPLAEWDYDGNPNNDLFNVQGASVFYGSVRVTYLPDYCNVLTREPMRRGTYAFEFVMHVIGDEQWCGVTTVPGLAGRRHSGRSLLGCFYYCGRRGQRLCSLEDGIASLHANRESPDTKFHAVVNGDVIGIAVDADVGAVAFSHNGVFQGACEVLEKKPLYLLTHLDQAGDHVELRRLADEENTALMEALRDEVKRISEKK